MPLNHLNKHNLWCFVLIILLFSCTGHIMASLINPDEDRQELATSSLPKQVDQDNEPEIDKVTDAQSYVVKAELGDAKSQYLLAVCYFHGVGNVKRDIIEAAYWAQRSAFSGYCDAQDLREKIYAPDTSSFKKLSEFFETYLKIIEQSDVGQGNVKAQVIVADHYLMKCLTEQTNVEAAEWYCKAASQGNPHAQIALGQLYLDKKVRPKENEDADVMAYTLFQQAAQQNNFQAVLKIVDCLNDGRGVRQNKKLAANYLLLHNLYHSTV